MVPASSEISDGERNRALHEIAQVAARRTKLNRAEQKIAELLLRAGADVIDELERLWMWKEGMES